VHEEGEGRGHNVGGFYAETAFPLKEIALSHNYLKRTLAVEKLIPKLAHI
jgi:hypothetical protein